MNKSGRTVTIFLTLIVIILISAVSISLFLLQQETQKRQSAEASLQLYREKSADLEGKLKETQKQVEILTGKHKDADDKINSLLDEMVVEKGLREESKKENARLKESLEAEAKSKLEIRQKMQAEIDEAQAKLKEFEKRDGSHKEQVDALQKKLADLETRNQALEKQLKDLNETGRQSREEIIPTPTQVLRDKVELDRIVVTPDSAKEGRVLNVDTETEFLIFDLGAKNGIKQGDIMSIFRGKTYLGDIRVTRVQEEMSAADFVPPFSSRKVRKNDLVTPKR